MQKDKGMTRIILLLVIVVILISVIVIAFKHNNTTVSNEVQVENESAIAQGNNSFIQRYNGMKYPVKSGIRRYIGEDPLRIYPNSNAPYIYEDYKPEVVELINEVGMNRETWCLVLDSRGVSGYVNRSDLIPIDEDKDEKYSRDYGNGIETLGGYKVGERIETLIGILDRDYYLAYENGRIYEFPDNHSKDIVVEPMNRLFSEIRSLDAFVGYTNRIRRLRTDSPEFPLQDGYKVGDNAVKVLNYYDSKYQRLDDEKKALYQYSGYTFILEEGHMMEFFIDTEELNQISVITSISID
ncbi:MULTISPECIES: hypothetical protein [unclassified Dehalobacter]|uniref:hypothetical protein n=1 Tax=unclassified Dehalobacter TaxID=2635733 RepID=UPI001FA9CDC4|nr:MULTISPECIES: hypothetical protein [unclassified Dehalobacter]